MRAYGLLFCFACLFMADASASIIDHGEYTRDTATGLDWLDVTATRGQSFSEVEARISSAGDLFGWRLAGASELSDLIYSVGGVSGWSVDNVLAISGLLGYMGDTVGESNAESGIVPLDFMVTYGFLYSGTGEIEYGDLRSGGLVTETGSSSSPDQVVTTTFGLFDIKVFADSYYYENSSSYIGSFLVRDSIQVSAPPPFILLALGLVGMLFGIRGNKTKS